MFHDREEAGHRLAERLKKRRYQNPVVLAIPCGGLVIGNIVARVIGAELNVVLTRKLRAPGQPELAIGAVGDDGQLYLNHFAHEVFGVTADYLAQERINQLSEMSHYRDLFHAVRPPALLAGRSVIVIDDGVATGSTLIAALRAVKSQHPLELLAAVPVASVEGSGGLEAVCRCCDEFVCLHCPQQFWSIDQFYADFRPISDDEAVAFLRSFAFFEPPSMTGPVAMTIAS